MSDSIYSIARERTLQSMQRVAEATISKKENVKPCYDRKESDRKYREGHAEQIHSSQKVYRETHGVEIKSSQKKYRDNLSPEQHEKRLEYMRHWREKHPDYNHNYYMAHKRKK